MFLRKGPNRFSHVYSLLLLFIFMNQQWYPGRTGLQSLQWSPAQTIPLYDSETWSPILVADQNRTVHAFSSQWIENGADSSVRAIVYHQWSLVSGWTAPVDIILPPTKEARLTDVFLDKEGVMHLVFFAGDNTFADIYYSKAPAVNAANAGAWSYPISIGENAGDPEGAVFFVDDQGTIFVIYNGREFGNGLYVVKSGNGGETWSDPIPIFFTATDEPNIFDLKVIKSKSGWFHAIWNVYNAAGQGRGIFYTRSQDGNEWSEPVLLADAEEEVGTQTPTIVEHNGILVVLYNMTPKITMRRSSDEGETWDNPSILFPRHVGANGSLSLVIDSNNELHLFWGQRITGSPDIHGMWHSIYRDGHWPEPEAVVKGAVVQDPAGNKGFDPSGARAIVSQGNTILVTWRTDPAAGPNGVWYSYTTTDAPALPVVELPTTLGIDGAPVVKTDIPPANLSTPESYLTEENNDKPSIQIEKGYPLDPSMPLIIGTSLALIVLIAVGVFISKGK